jgi:uncharacterized protein YceH (UPF0502 family)
MATELEERIEELERENAQLHERITQFIWETT